MREGEEKGQRAVDSRKRDSECINNRIFRLKSFQSTTTAAFKQANFGIAERVPTCKL